MTKENRDRGEGDGVCAGWYAESDVLGGVAALLLHCMYS